MKTNDLLNRTKYLRMKRDLLDSISSSQLHPIVVYKIAKDLSSIEMKRSKLNLAGITSSISFTTITGCTAVPIGSKLLIGSTGILLSVLVTEYFKNRISIRELNEIGDQTLGKQ